MILNPILPVVLLIALAALCVWLVLLMPTKVLKVLSASAGILILIVGMRPMVPNGESISYKNNLDVIFVMDGTLSMLAEDYNGNERRIDAVTDDVQFIVNELTGAYYSLISFDNKSYINLRSTVDVNAAVTAAKTIHQTNALYAKGSAVTIFKDDLEKVLKVSAKKGERKRIVFVMTDGENTSDQGMASLASLQQYVDGGAVLGYGTTQGGKMKADKYGNGEYSYLEDRSEGYPYQDAVSKLDENNLKKMAGELGVDYIHMEKQSNVRQKLDELKAMRDLGEGESEYAYDDIYYYFCWLLLPILLVELFLMRREFR